MHNEKEQDELFDNYEKSLVCNALGPRMTISGWMSYYRGIEFWDRQHNERAFGITAWSARRGDLAGKFPEFNFVPVHCEKSAPGSTKKSKESMAAEVRALKSDQVKAMAQLYLQGWYLQRKVRHLKLATTSSERHFHFLHTKMRGNSATFEHFQYLASPEGLAHCMEVFTIYEDAKHQRYMGMVTVEADLPLKLDTTVKREYIKTESQILGEDFVLKVNLSGQLLRRSLWHVEGLPGFLMYCQREREKGIYSQCFNVSPTT